MPLIEEEKLKIQEEEKEREKIRFQEQTKRGLKAFLIYLVIVLGMIFIFATLSR